MEKYTYKDTLINSTLTFVDDDFIYTDTEVGHEVMGRYESPLMEKYAEIINHNNGDILEIGFGLGLFATKVYSMGLKSYTIVEFHPQVIEKLHEWAKDKNNVTIIEGDWMDHIELINSTKYDGIFFDTHMDDNRPKFRELIVEKCIKDNGVFGYFRVTEDDTFKYGDNLNETIIVTCLPRQNEMPGNFIASHVKYPLKVNI